MRKDNKRLRSRKIKRSNEFPLRGEDCGNSFVVRIEELCFSEGCCGLVYHSLYAFVSICSNFGQGTRAACVPPRKVLVGFIIFSIVLLFWSKSEVYHKDGVEAMLIGKGFFCQFPMMTRK